MLAARLGDLTERETQPLCSVRTRYSCAARSNMGVACSQSPLSRMARKDGELSFVAAFMSLSASALIFATCALAAS